MNNAPIDIVISLIDQHIAAAQEQLTCNNDYKDGYVTGLEDLKDELEGFKKLFN